jgi:hypothetical protein
MNVGKQDARWSRESKVLVALAAAFLLVIILSPFGVEIFGSIKDGRNRRRLIDESDHRAVAMACAGLIRNLGTNEAVDFKGTDLSLPAVIRSLNSRGVCVYTNQVRIVFGHNDRSYFLEFLDESFGGPLLRYSGYGNVPTKTLYSLTPSDTTAVK